MGMEFKAPNFKKLIEFISNIPQHFEELSYEFEKQEAELFLKTIKGHIEKQDLPWEPLKEGYLKKKIRFGLNPGMWIATGELYNHLQVVEYQGSFYIGAPVGTTHEQSGLEVNDIIKIHEYGALAVGIPARPLFMPSRSGIGGAKRVRRYVVLAKEHLVRVYKTTK